MMIRTLERDRQHIESFKTKDVMDKFFEQAIRKARDELLAIKNEKGKIGLRKQDERKLDDMVKFITLYSLEFQMSCVILIMPLETTQ